MDFVSNSSKRQMQSNTGAYLKIILGPMFSGKTSQLIRIYKQSLDHPFLINSSQRYIDLQKTALH